MRTLLEKNLSGFLSSILLVIVLLSGAGEYFGIALPIRVSVWIAVGALLFFHLFRMMKWKGRLITVLSMLACLIITILVVGRENAALFADDYFGWLMGIASETESFNTVYQVFQIIFFAAVCFMFDLWSQEVFYLQLGAAGAGILWLFIDLFTDRNLEHMGVVAMLGYIVMVYIGVVQLFWKKQKKNPDSPYLIWIQPFLLLFLVLLALTPAPKKPYDWQFVKDAYKSIRETINSISYNIQWNDKEDFDQAVGGFSGDGKMAGSVGEESKLVMQIQPRSGLKTNVYLIGKIYDTFENNQWIQNYEEKNHDRTLDAMETMYAVWQYDKKNMSDYIHSNTLDVSYKYFTSKILFAPLKTWYVIHEDELVFEDKGGNLYMRKYSEYGTSYGTSYYEINVNHPLFDAFLEVTPTEDETLWEEIQYRYNRNDKKYTPEDMAERRNRIYSTYGTEETLSAEMQAYLEQITAGAVTDLEKLKAIEEAVSKLTYTKTPGRIPEDVDTPEEFLDYFIFESKEGYCSHFATAFVLLARAAGFPARYVEGYCVPLEGLHLKDVYSNMAHAWPEVYIDRIGWIPFEPTPGYASIRYTPWEKEEEIIPSGTISFTPIEEDEEEEETEIDLPTELPVPVNTAGRNLFLITVYTALAVVVILWIFLMTDRKMRRRRYRRLSVEDKFRTEVQKTLQVLLLLGYKRHSYETLDELQKRAWAVTEKSVEGKEITLQFLKLYEDTLYGAYPVRERMVQAVRNERAYLLEALKKWKYVRYLIYLIGAGGMR